jgi:hypothetical protein
MMIVPSATTGWPLGPRSGPRGPSHPTADRCTAPHLSYPPVERAGFRQREMNAHSGAVRGGGQPVAQDDSSNANTRVAIKKPTLVLMGGSSPTPVSSTDPSAHIRLTVLRVCLPILRVLRRQGRVANDQHVLRVFPLSGLGEIEAPRDEGFPVDNDDLIMRNGVLGINRRGHALVGQEIGGGVFLRALALVEDHLHLHTPLMGVEERLGNGGRGEAVGLDEDAAPGSGKGVNDEISVVASWGEAHRRPGRS